MIIAEAFLVALTLVSLFTLFVQEENNLHVKARTKLHNWPEVTRFSFWRTDQWASKRSLLVIGWYVRQRSHVRHGRR